MRLASIVAIQLATAIRRAEETFTCYHLEGGPPCVAGRSGRCRSPGPRPPAPCPRHPPRRPTSRPPVAPPRCARVSAAATRGVRSGTPVDHSGVRSRMATPRAPCRPSVASASTSSCAASPSTTTTMPSPPVRVRVVTESESRRGPPSRTTASSSSTVPAPSTALAVLQPAVALVGEEPQTVTLARQVHRDGRGRGDRPLEAGRRSVAAVAGRPGVEQDRRPHLPRLLVPAHHQLSPPGGRAPVHAAQVVAVAVLPGRRRRPRRTPPRCG